MEAELIQVPRARSVKFYIDSQLVGEDTTQPYQYTWDTKTYSDGQHQIYASVFQAPEHVPDQANPPLLNSSVVNVIVDNSPPTTPQVTDDGQYTNSLNTLHATWTQSSDPTSGILGYQYSIGTSQGLTDLIDWIFVGTDAEITLTNLDLQHGKTYYFNVKAINGAGLIAVGTSDGITTNAHTPQITRVIPYNNSTLYIGTDVTIEVTAQDLDFDPLEYQFLVDGQVKQSWSSLNTFDWTVEPSTSDTHLITIQVRDDKGGFVSEDVTYNIQTVPLDDTPPSAPIITTEATSNSLESILASWISEDAESGIIEYQYAIGTTPGGTDIVYWTSYGTNTEAFILGLNLTQGQNYYLSVVAKNGAGLKSQVSTSSAIRAAKEPRLKITWPQDNAIISVETIKGIAEGIDQVTINGKTVNVNPDETFEGPTLVGPGWATKWGVPEDDPELIIMNFPGPTAISATAGGQTQTITVYCYDVFVKKDRLSQLAVWWPGFYYLYFLEQRQSWNTYILTQPPFPGWAQPFYDSRFRGEGWYYSPWVYYDALPFHYPRDFRDYSDYAICTSPYAEGVYESETMAYTQMTIHTLPAIDGPVQPMILVFKGCQFGGGNPSQYTVNGQPLKMLYGEYPNAYYIVLTDYQPDSDLEIQATMPTYNYTTEYCEVTSRYFSFQDIDVLRLETVREIPYNSGNYVAVNAIPIFVPDDGKGRGPSSALMNMAYLTVLFGEELSSSVINTAQVSLKIADVKKTYSLTESSLDSGVFTDSTNSFSLRLDNPSIQLNSNVQDEITCFATSTSDNIVEQVFNLKESASDSLYFNDVKTFVTVIFDNELLPYQNDTLTIYYTNGLLASKETLTETTADSLIFTNEDNTFIVRLNNYPGTMPDNVDITINNQDYLELKNPRLMLEKANSSPYVYTNEPLDEGSDLPPNNPLDDGQGVFRVRVKGLYSYGLYNPETLSVTLTTEVESKTLTLTRQPDGSYMTDRIVFLPQDATTAYDGIICLRSTSGEGKLEAKLNEDIKQNLDVSKAAFVGSSIHSFFIPSVFTNVSDIESILHKDLGYAVNADGRLTKQDVLNALPNYSVWYSLTHGDINWEKYVFDKIRVAMSEEWSGEAVDIFPSDIRNNIGDNKYKLVFLNGCLTAHEKEGSAADEFKQAFNTDTYVGWTTIVYPWVAADSSTRLFQNLDGGQTIDDAYNITRRRGGDYLFLKYLGKGSTIIDLTP